MRINPALPVVPRVVHTCFRGVSTKTQSACKTCCESALCRFSLSEYSSSSPRFLLVSSLGFSLPLPFLFCFLLKKRKTPKAIRFPPRPRPRPAPWLPRAHRHAHRGSEAGSGQCSVLPLCSAFAHCPFFLLSLPPHAPLPFFPCCAFRVASLFSNPPPGLPSRPLTRTHTRVFFNSGYYPQTT